MNDAPFVVPAPVGVVQVTGADRTAYLEDVTTQHLAEVSSGRCLGTLHLDPKGSVLATMDVVIRADDLLLLVPDELVEHATDVLGGRTFLLDANFQLTDHRVLSVRGEAASTHVQEVLGAAPPAGEVSEVEDLLVVGRDEGVDLVAAPDSLDRARGQLEAAGIRQGHERDLDDWRIHVGLPRWGREIVAGRLPEELGLLPSHVHLAKGCYPGQEAVARMWMLGQPRRRLALMTASGGVEPGWESGEGRGRIEVTSVTSRGDVALGFVPSNAGPGQRSDGPDGTSVTVERIIGDTLDVPGHDPAVVRRRDRRRSEAGAQ